jgi:putative RecB family exonuclease
VQYEQRSLGGVQFYAFLCQRLLGRIPARIQLLYLSEPLAIIATPSAQSARGLEQRVGAVWAAVERACEREDFRPRPGPLCDYCAFRAYCPAVGGDLDRAREASLALATV